MKFKFKKKERIETQLADETELIVTEPAVCLRPPGVEMWGPGIDS